MREHEFQSGIQSSSRYPKSAGLSPASSAVVTQLASSHWGGHRGIDVALIDEFPLRRASTLNLLRSHLRDGAKSFGSAVELLSQVLSTAENPSCIIMCVGGRSVVEAPGAEELLRLGIALASTPVIILSDREESAEILAAFRRGARGYIPTSLEPLLVIEALRIVLAGGTFFPAEALIRSRRKAPAPIKLPSAPSQAVEQRDEWPPRQLAVLRLLVQGKANKEIAHALTMEERKVKVHIGIIMRKLGAANRTQAALHARRLGIPVAQEAGLASIDSPPRSAPALASRLGSTPAVV